MGFGGVTRGGISEGEAMLMICYAIAVRILRKECDTDILFFIAVLDLLVIYIVGSGCLVLFG